MNNLKIYYIQDTNTKLGFINSIYYEDKCLASFNGEENKINLSVLYPFVTKVADFYRIDSATKTIKHKEVIIDYLETDENGEIKLYMSDKNQEINDKE